MRTCILLAGWGIADASREHWVKNEIVSFMAIVLLISMIMDIVEFFHKLLKVK